MESLKKKPLTEAPGNQPQGLSKTTQYSLKDAVTFSIGEESMETLERMGFSRDEAASLVYRGFWKYMVSSISEKHAEGHHLLNPIADTFLVFSTGAMPIQISMSGYLYTAKDQDHRLDFVNLYHNRLRGTLLRKHRFVIVLAMKDTVMRLRLQAVNMSYDSRLDSWTAMTLKGIGFSYTVSGTQQVAEAPQGDEMLGTFSIGEPTNEAQWQDPEVRLMG